MNIMEECQLCRTGLRVYCKNKDTKNINLKNIQHTTLGIRWSSPTQLLIQPSLAYLWESGRDPEFSSGYGRMYLVPATEMLIWAHRSAHGRNEQIAETATILETGYDIRCTNLGSFNEYPLLHFCG
jgi:hypothetical protein